MFTITQFEFKNPAFENALYRVCNVHYTDEKTLYNLAKIVRRYKALSKELQTKWENLYNQYALKDESGNIIPIDGKPMTFKIDPAKKEEWEKALSDFNVTPVEFDCHKIRLSAITEAKITALELVELENIIEDQPYQGPQLV